jgi:DNA-binding response OmpR family regulator
VAQILVLTNALAPSTEVLPALGLLPHSVRVLPAEASVLVDEPTSDAVLVDGRRELAAARSLCRLLRTTGLSQPLLLVVTEGGMAAVAADWGADDILLDTCGPAELDARLRLAAGRVRRPVEDDDGVSPSEIRAGDVVIDEAAYSARVRGRQLDLTYKEFELLKHLAQHPGRVFTRAQLLQEVWGYDYFGGTRTVDVHVRRLRAKLGAEHENAIGTVRNVGYRFVSSGRDLDDRLGLDSDLVDPLGDGFDDGLGPDVDGLDDGIEDGADTGRPAPRGSFPRR